MTDRVPRRSEVDRAAETVDGEAGLPAASATGADATDAYEVEDGVVLYDVNNPLAWVESDTTMAVEGMA